MAKCRLPRRKKHAPPAFNIVKGKRTMKKKSFSQIKKEMVIALREKSLLAPVKSVEEVSRKIGRPSEEIEMMSAEEFFSCVDD